MFNIVTEGGLLGSAIIATGNTQKVRCRMEGFLDPGVRITSATLAITTGATVSTATRSDDQRNFWFFVTAPTADVSFTVTVTVVTTDGQTLVYTIEYLSVE